MPLSPRSSYRTRTLAAAACVLASWTCDQQAAGPGRRAVLAVEALLPATDLAAFNLTIDNARLIVVSTTGDTVFDKTFSFPANQSSLPVSADIPLDASPASFHVTIHLLSGTTLLFEGTRDITLTGETATPLQVPVTYSGPGQNVASLTIDPADSSLSFGASLTFRPTARDAQGNPVTSFYVSWSTSDTVAAPIDATGTLVAPVVRQTVTITAHTPNNVSASTPITFAPVATGIGVVSGCGQMGAPGAQLSQPIVARVVAADGLGVKDVAVTFTPPSGGSVSPAQAVTDATGLAQTTATLGATPGPASFTISAGGLTSASCVQTVLSQATQLAFTTQPPASAAAGALFSVAVTARDAMGNPAASFTGNVTLALGANPGGAIFTPVTVAAVTGVATFTGLELDKAGTGYTLSASATGLIPATSTSLAITPGAPARVVFTVPPALAVTAGVPISPAIAVSIEDAFSNVVSTATSTVSVALGANPGGATLGGTTSRAAVAGVATYSDLTIDSAGTGYTLVATSPGLTPDTSQAFDVSAGVAATLAFTSPPTDIVAGGGEPVIQVSALDGQGNLATGFTGSVTLALGTHPAGATLTGTLTVSAVSGVAMFSNLAGFTVAGSYTLVATSSSLSVESAPFTVSAGAASQVAVTVQPSNAAVAVPITPPVVVTVEDAFGNPVLTATNAVSLAIGSNPGAAVLGGTLTRSAAAGLATFADLTLDKTGTGYTLVATATGLGPDTSSTFDVAAGGAVGLALTLTPVTDTAGAARTLVVTAQDGLGNTASGYRGTVHFTSTDGQAVLPADYTFTAGDNGSHTFSGGVTLKTAGTRSVTGRDLANGSITGVQAVSVSPATAAALFFTVQPGNASVGAALTPPVQVTARDAYGNTATGFLATVTLGLGNNPGGATLGGTTAVAASAGVAVFPGLTLDQAGTGYTLTAAATGVAGATSTPFNISVVGATPNAWMAAGGGFWSVAGNWSLGRVPQATDSVVISLAGTYSVTLDTTVSVAFLTFGGSSGTQSLAMSGRTLTVTNAATIQNGAGATLSGGTLAGAAALTNQGTLTLASSTINTAVDNQGVLVIHGTNAINGALTAAGGSTLRVEGTGTQGTGTLTVANGFTNNGLIELTNNSINQAATLNVTSGTLANAGTINVLSGAGGGARTLGVQLDNQATGTLTLSQPLTLSKSGAAHTNSGTINVSGADWTLTQSGTTPSFTNTGTVTIGTGRTWTVSAGTLNLSGGSVGGAGTLALNGLTANMATGFTNSTTSLVVTSSTLNGPGTLTNVASQTLTLTSAAVEATMPLVNQGLLVIHGTNAINGALTAAGGSTLRVEGTGTQGTGTLTVASGFTNAGAIELTNSSINQAATLNVTSGTLANTGTINVLAGQGGGARMLGVQLDNQATGTLTLSQPLTLSKSGAAHTNSGTINVSGADWTLTQSGTTPSFTNTGTITIGAGWTWTVSAGTLNLSGGSVGGAGTLALSGLTANIATGFTNSTTSLVVTNSTLNGPGTLTNVASQTLTLTSSTVGATMPLVNQGLLVIHGTNAINGALTAAGGSTLRVEGTGTQGTGTLTVASGFTNAGLIELTNNSINQAATLNVTSGTLANAGTINVLSGAGGGARTLGVQLDNQATGTVMLSQPLTLNKSGAVHTNSGTIDVSGADWTLSQSGTTPSFTNTGTVTIGTGRTWTVSAGTLNLSGGSVGGAGTLALNGLTANMATGFTNSTTSLVVTSSTLNGPGTLTNAAGQTLPLTSSTVGATMPLVNQGILLIHGGNAINGVLTTAGGSTLRVEGTGSQGTGALTVANGFTNNGLIELANNSINQAATLTVSSGTLANADTIHVLGGGGARTLAAQLDNQATGTVIVDQPLTLSKSGAAHTNSGTLIMGGGDLVLSQSGASPSFTTDGIVYVDVGRTWSVTGGAVDYTGGAVGGYGTIALNSVTLGLGVTLTHDTLPAFLSVSLTNSTVNGPGTLAVALSSILTLTGATVNAPVANFGTVEATPGTNVLNGAVNNVSGALLRLNGTTGFADVTVANGFTNTGSIELTGTSAAGRLTVGSPTLGTLVNAAGATLMTTGGTGNVLAAFLDNQGTVQVGGPLTLNAASAGHSNSGLIKLSGGDFTVVESGTRPGFSNTGTIDVGTNKMAVTGTGSFINQSTGTLMGSGTFDVSSSNLSFLTNGITTVGGAPGVGILTFVGTYIMGPTGSINVEIGGAPNPGVTFDQLHADSVVFQSGGTLNAADLGGTSGNNYPVLTSAKPISGGLQVFNIPTNCTAVPSSTQYVLQCQ